MAKMTSDELFSKTIEANLPLDAAWLRTIKRTSTEKELLAWARENVEYCAPKGASKQLIGRAATKLADFVNSRF